MIDASHLHWRSGQILGQLEMEVSLLHNIARRMDRLRGGRREEGKNNALRGGSFSRSLEIEEVTESRARPSSPEGKHCACGYMPDRVYPENSVFCKNESFLNVRFPKLGK